MRCPSRGCGFESRALRLVKWHGLALSRITRQFQGFSGGCRFRLRVRAADDGSLLGRILSPRFRLGPRPPHGPSRRPSSARSASQRSVGCGSSTPYRSETETQRPTRWRESIACSGTARATMEPIFPLCPRGARFLGCVHRNDVAPSRCPPIAESNHDAEWEGNRRRRPTQAVRHRRADDCICRRPLRCGTATGGGTGTGVAVACADWICGVPAGQTLGIGARLNKCLPRAVAISLYAAEVVATDCSLDQTFATEVGPTAAPKEFMNLRAVK